MNLEAMQAHRSPQQSVGQMLSRTGLQSSMIGASVMTAFLNNIIGTDELPELVRGLSESCKRVKGGDLSNLEAMLG